MNIDLTEKEFRRLLDMVYIGNWVLNSTRESDRFEDYDIVEEKIFSLCAKNGMGLLVETWRGHSFPSKAFEDGGIHEAIEDYETAVFYDILAQMLAERDMIQAGENESDIAALTARMNEYMEEFEENGIDNLRLK